MAMKPQAPRTATRTSTANWQYDSADYADGMDNANQPSYKMLSRAAHNQFTGYSNDGRLVNKGRGPTRGNQDFAATAAGSAGADRKPPAAPGGMKMRYSNSDSINMGRGPTNPGSTTTVRQPANPDRIQSGRGPTKGNQQ